MEKLDQLIEEALRESETPHLETFEEKGWFALGLSQFTGKLGWVTWVIMSVQVGLFVLGAFCAVRFFAQTETLGAVQWGLPALGLILMALQIKLSLMPQIQADRVILEIKRLQLLVATKSE